jgi:hypothetical protein
MKIKTQASSSFEGLWTTDDVAAYLRISPRMVQRLRSSGKLCPPVSVGRLPRWSPNVVREFVLKGGCGS